MNEEAAKPLALSSAQREQFFAEGYVMVPDLFARNDLEPMRREIDEVIDTAAQRLADDGIIGDTFISEKFETRLTQLVATYPEQTSIFMRSIEGKAGGGHTGTAIFDLLTHPRLLDAMEALVGPEIVASSVYRIRPKIPKLGRGIVPWHQDSGYFSASCDANMIVTCWIPLVDATPENGCLQVLPNMHRQGVVTHHMGGNAGFLVIEDSDLPMPPEQAITVPVPLGGALLLTNLTPHCSLPNTTEVIRWSIDLRYQGLDAPTNAFLEPEAFQPDVPIHEIACYAPEADFMVRSRKHPEAVLDYVQFADRRRRYDDANLPHPRRGWQPVTTA